MAYNMNSYNHYDYNESQYLDGKRNASDAGIYEDDFGIVPLPAELTKMFKPLECELCGVTVSSQVTAYAHYEGKIHVKNVNDYMRDHYNVHGSLNKKAKVQFEPVRCDVCNVECGSLIQAQQHFYGKVHAKNMRKVQYVDPSTLATEPAADLSLFDGDMDILNNLPPPPPPPKLSDYICEICNISTNTEHQLVAHKNGSKHKRKVKKLQEENGIRGVDGISYYVGDIPTAQGCLDAEGQPFAAESLVDPYYSSMPLANEPLQFSNNISNPGWEALQVGLCIKWYRDKGEVPPERPSEQEYQEIFSKEGEYGQRVPPAPPSSPVAVPRQEPSRFQPPPTPPEPLVKERQAPPEVAKMPPFSVASVLYSLSSANTATKNDTAGPQTAEQSALSGITPLENGIKSYRSMLSSSLLTVENFTALMEKLKEPSSECHVESETKGGEFTLTNWQSDEMSKESKEASVEEDCKEEPKDDCKEDESDSKSQSKKKPIVHFITGFKKQLESKKKGDEGQDELPVKDIESVKKNYVRPANKPDKPGKNSKKTKSIDELQEMTQPTDDKEVNNESGTTSEKNISNESKMASYVVKADEMTKKSDETVTKENEKSSKEEELSEKYDKRTKDDENSKRKNSSRSKERSGKYENSRSWDKYTDAWSRKPSPNRRRNDGYGNNNYKRNRNYNGYYNNYDNNNYFYRNNNNFQRNYRNNYNGYRRQNDYQNWENEHNKNRKSRRSNSNDRKYKHDRKRHSSSSSSSSSDQSSSSSSSSSDDSRRRKRASNDRKKHSHQEAQSKKKSQSKSKKESRSPSAAERTKDLLKCLAPVSETESKDLAMYRIPSGLYYCVTCDYKSKCRHEFTRHLHSKQHKDKRSKMQKK